MITKYVLIDDDNYHNNENDDKFVNDDKFENDDKFAAPPDQGSSWKVCRWESTQCPRLWTAGQSWTRPFGGAEQRVGFEIVFYLKYFEDLNNLVVHAFKSGLMPRK